MVPSQRGGHAAVAGSVMAANEIAAAIVKVNADQPGPCRKASRHSPSYTATPPTGHDLREFAEY